MRRETPELLDNPAAVLPDLAQNLADIRRLNAWFGGGSVLRAQVRPFLRAGGAVTLLDVATGSGDLPLGVARWAARRGAQVDVTGLDSSPEILSEAKRFRSGAAITLTQGDARQLPFEDGSFDLVSCCLALHHFGVADATAMLAEMWRVARRAVLVNDLRRGYAAYAGTWLVTHTVTRNRLTRHDGPISVLRAYTPEEVRVLAYHAGLHRVTIRRALGFRYALTARKEDRGGSG